MLNNDTACPSDSVYSVVVSVVVSAQCLGVSLISTLEVLTWPFLTTRMRSLRVKPITSVGSGQTTSSTQVNPKSRHISL